MTTVRIPVLKVKQPIGEFLIGSIEARELYEISYADIRRVDGRDIERYIGTQRELSEGRVAEIKKYVTTVDACFPTGIIISVPAEHVTYREDSEAFAVIEIASDEGKVAKIIDGQHRIAGFEHYAGEPFFLNVTIFVEMEIEDQAMVFATINLKQTKVSKSLAYDLYEFAASRSPQKTCHNIARILNFKTGSPLEGFIKILGKSTDKEAESITQATFVDRLLKLISRDAMADKDLLKRGKTPARASGSDRKRLLFRNTFLRGQDARIAFVLWEYFAAVELRWPEALRDRTRGYLLGRTTGFAALMRLLPDVVTRITVRPLDEDTSEIHREEFLNILKTIDLDADRFTTDFYKPGSSGEGALLADLLAFLQNKEEKWTPFLFDDHPKASFEKEV